MFSDLRNEQSRQIIDAEQVLAAFRSAEAEYRSRFAGSMTWKTIGQGSYLYRKVKQSSRSLGVRSDETEAIFRAFQDGRDRLRGRLATLKARLDQMAPVNRALGIGRMPLPNARILRGIGTAGLMGSAIDVVGTNALFAYERMCAVQIESGLMATGDVDLLFDSRRSLKLVSPDVRSEGLLGLLRKVDASFELTGQRSFRAVNDAGFMVDLIRPMPRHRISTAERTSIGPPGDLEAVEIEGLGWLVNSPKVEVVVIDERGYPLRISVADPRPFAMHKAWLSARADREPIKRRRDQGQARLIARLVTERLPHLRFDAPDLSALPLAMREAAPTALLARRDSDEDDRDIEPNW